MLPIRRFHLDPGESQEFTAVWARFPDLSVSPLTQKYTHIDTGTYMYQSIHSGYQSRLIVDAEGAVIEYTGAWKRM
jgi:hypothetical protein